MKLVPADFDAFFREVHGVAPFDWQRRLAAAACEGAWPDFVDVPTGCGKTASLDAAVFALALSTFGKELAPRRIVMVVDRRVVVDQSHRRACTIRDALAASPVGSVARRVATALSKLSSTGTPLEAVLLRGAVPRDDQWARTPDQPMIVSSTVDQVGSRLLFRGYGVSPSMWPVHAGLLGSDCLYLLDEVHLSRPYAQTLDRLKALSESLATPMFRFRSVSLSATPGDTGTATSLGLGPDDRAGPLKSRLTAPKPIRIESTSLAELPTAIAAEVADHLGEATAVLVVVNRVQRAHDVFRALQNRLSASADVALLTGRMRPIDRDERVRAIIDRVASGRSRGTERPIVVVATQCIEAGADFDFDSIVTELASFEALRQRFGRVDRLGLHRKARGTIFEVQEPDEAGELSLPKDDPVYGDRLIGCLKLLRALKPKKGEVDFGIEALNKRLAEVDVKLIASATSEVRNAPALFPAYVELWAQTRPSSRHEPDLGRFLHGPPSTPDVSIVWRGDLAEVSDEEACERLDALPPSTVEAVSVPFLVARRWLAGGDAGRELADIEGQQYRNTEEHPTRRAILWTGDGAQLLDRTLLPGMTVVVESQAGGLFEGSFDGAASTPVEDRAEEASRIARGRLTLRAEFRNVGLSGDGELIAPANAPDWVIEFCDGLQRSRRLVELNDWTLLVSKKRLTAGLGEATTDDAVSAMSGKEVALLRHSNDVERWAKGFTERLRLPKEDAAAIVFAAWLHDVGKADPRFQRLLRDGTEASVRIAARKAKDDSWILAKSAMSASDRSRARRAAARSTYPQGARHEVLSAAMCDTEIVRSESVRRGVRDFDLVLHLVASHHGWCRPFAPAIADDSPLTVTLQHGALRLESAAATTLHRLDSGLADRFAALNDRYGWHRLAALEMMLRLADHRASEEEANDADA